MMSRFTVALVVMASLSATVANAAPPTTGIPQYDNAVRSAISGLKAALKAERKPHGGYQSIIAFALVTAKESPDSPEIAEAIDEVKKRITSSGYTPSDSSHHIYEAGVDAMLLAEASGDKYFNELQAISDYIVQKQQPSGAWDYPSPTVGDTSMAQYAILGLWAASRSGIDVPLQAFDKACAWHIRTQLPDGGFAYHPGERSSTGTGGGGSTLNMTAGATGTLAIAKMHLYEQAVIEKKDPKKPFGILEAKVDESEQKRKTTYRPQTPRSAIDGSITRGIGWLTSRFKPRATTLDHKLYYNYALERTCALNGITKIGGKVDWYRAAGDVLIPLQNTEGTWDAHSVVTNPVAASFAVLFFLRPTKKTVAAQFGGGLLTGGRGLPTDLANADVTGNGVAEKRKIEGPLDELLSELSKQDPDQMALVQTAIVEKVQLGNREELIGELDRIRKLAKHPDPEIRRTAIWALGRSGQLKDADLLITALEDFNVDVLVEANNSLCYLSRKIEGVGIPTFPFEDLPEDATDAQRNAALGPWKKAAMAGWKAWYIRIRPYKDRNDLFELGLSKSR